MLLPKTRLKVDAMSGKKLSSKNVFTNSLGTSSISLPFSKLCSSTKANDAANCLGEMLSRMMSRHLSHNSFGFCSVSTILAFGDSQIIFTNAKFAFFFETTKFHFFRVSNVNVKSASFQRFTHFKF